MHTSTFSKINVSTTLANSNPIAVAAQVLNQVYIPSTLTTLTKLTWYGSPDGVNWFLGIEAGTNGEVSVAYSKTYRIPLELIACRFVKALATFSDAVTDGDIYVSVKS
jgi:hypothetical protein